MKKYLLPNTGNYYKANLHCHTTVSDGKRTPEQVKDDYKAKGYSIVAYTDHDLMLDHSDLSDGDFLALKGYEIEITQRDGVEPWRNRRCCHLCLIAKSSSVEKQVCWHREKYLFGGAPALKHLAVFDESLPDFEREYTVECVNEVIKRAKEGGFLVHYNHPNWSMETFEQFGKYEGFSGMEIANYSAYSVGFDDYYPQAYEEVVRLGKRVYCIGADDNHRLDDECGAWTMINAPRLEYGEIIKSLESGAVYSSMGPEIKAIYFEDGKIHIESSPASRIIVHRGTRWDSCARANEGETISEAAFDFNPSALWFRVTVIDEKGRPADSRAYFSDEIYGE